MCVYSFEDVSALLKIMYESTNDMNIRAFEEINESPDVRKQSHNLSLISVRHTHGYQGLDTNTRNGYSSI